MARRAVAAPPPGVRCSRSSHSPAAPIWNLRARCGRKFLTAAKLSCYRRSCYNEDGGGNSSTGRAPDCGSDGCGFDSRFPPQIYLLSCRGALVPTLPQSLRDAIDFKPKTSAPSKRDGRLQAGPKQPSNLGEKVCDSLLCASSLCASLPQASCVVPYF